MGAILWAGQGADETWASFARLGPSAKLRAGSRGRPPLRGSRRDMQLFYCRFHSGRNFLGIATVRPAVVIGSPARISKGWHLMW